MSTAAAASTVTITNIIVTNSTLNSSDTIPAWLGVFLITYTILVLSFLLLEFIDPHKFRINFWISFIITPTIISSLAALIFVLVDYIDNNMLLG